MKRKIYLVTIISVLTFSAVITGFVVKSQNSQVANVHPDYQLLVESMKGNFNAVKQMLNTGVDPNTPPKPNDRGLTALMLASWKGHTEIVRLLVKKGANVNAVSNMRSDALMLASSGGHLECVRILLNNGANTERTMPNNSTAFKMALEKSYVEVVKLFLVKERDDEMV